MHRLLVLALPAALAVGLGLACQPEDDDTGDTGDTADTSDSEDSSDSDDTSDTSEDTTEDTTDTSEDTSDTSEDTSDTSEDTNCDGLCVTQLEVQLSTDATTYAVRVVIPELAMDQTFSCDQGALLVTGVGPNSWPECVPTGVNVMFEDQLHIPASIQLAVNGGDLTIVAPELTPQAVCGTTCTSGSVFF